VAGRPRLLGLSFIGFAIFKDYQKSKPEGSGDFRPALTLTARGSNYGKSHRPSYYNSPFTMFADPFPARSFAAAEDDGLAPDLAEIDNPLVLSGGAAELIPAAGHRVRMLIEA
jgi:hypothetical protein